MDVNDLRIAVTILSFLLFAGIVRWALSPRNKAAFDEARQLPVLDSGEADGALRGAPHGGIR